MRKNTYVRNAVQNLKYNYKHKLLQMLKFFIFILIFLKSNGIFIINYEIKSNKFEKFQIAAYLLYLIIKPNFIYFFSYIFNTLTIKIYNFKIF